MITKKEVEEARDILLEVCDTNADVDWNGAEARDEFNDMYSLIDLLFIKLTSSSDKQLTFKIISDFSKTSSFEKLIFAPFFL